MPGGTGHTCAVHPTEPGTCPPDSRSGPAKSPSPGEVPTIRRRRQLSHSTSTTRAIQQRRSDRRNKERYRDNNFSISADHQRISSLLRNQIASQLTRMSGNSSPVGTRSCRHTFAVEKGLPAIAKLDTLAALPPPIVARERTSRDETRSATIFLSVLGRKRTRRNGCQRQRPKKMELIKEKKEGNIIQESVGMDFHPWISLSRFSPTTVNT